jgi:hypothetical protein
VNMNSDQVDTLETPVMDYQASYARE